MNGIEKFAFQIFVPGGNDTALAFGLPADLSQRWRKAISETIREKHKNVEQVGFVGDRTEASPWLVMAGGEFCGNAARAAAYYYLEGGPGETKLTVSGVSEPIEAGVAPTGAVWARVPIRSVRAEGEAGVFLVELEGISHVVFPREQSAPFLTGLSDPPTEDEKDRLKRAAKEILARYELLREPAAGVIFLEGAPPDSLKIHPCVHVSKENTFYYETACGTGTAAAGAVSRGRGEGNEFSIAQPSGEIIKTFVEDRDLKVYVKISGAVGADQIVYEETT